MTNHEISLLLNKQQHYYRTGATLSLSFRMEQLKKLRTAIQAYEKDIHAALAEDLGKASYEAYMCETGLALSEISYMLKHLK